MIAGTAITKSINAAWAAGTGNGGRGTGVALTANGWYHVFAGQQAAGAYDAWFDTSPIGANKPAAFTTFRRLGSVQLDASSNLVPWIQQGDLFLWGTERGDLTWTGSGTYALHVPPGVQVMWQGSVHTSGTNLSIYLTTPGVTHYGWAGHASGSSTGASFVSMLTDTAQSLIFTFYGAGTVYAETRGWIDRRGKDGP